MAQIILALGGSKSKIDSVWPLDGVEKDTFAPPTQEWWDKMKAKQAQVDKLIKAKHGR